MSFVHLFWFDFEIYKGTTIYFLGRGRGRVENEYPCLAGKAEKSLAHKTRWQWIFYNLRCTMQELIVYKIANKVSWNKIRMCRNMFPFPPKYWQWTEPTSEMYETWIFIVFTTVQENKKLTSRSKLVWIWRKYNLKLSGWERCNCRLLCQ